MADFTGDSNTFSLRYFDTLDRRESRGCRSLYPKTGAVAVGVGGRLVDKDAVARGDWGAITAEAQRLVAAVR